MHLVALASFCHAIPHFHTFTLSLSPLPIRHAFPQVLYLSQQAADVLVPAPAPAQEQEQERQVWT